MAAGSRPDRDPRAADADVVVLGVPFVGAAAWGAHHRPRAAPRCRARARRGDRVRGPGHDDDRDDRRVRRRDRRRRRGLPRRRPGGRLATPRRRPRAASSDGGPVAVPVATRAVRWGRHPISLPAAACTSRLGAFRTEGLTDAPVVAHDAAAERRVRCRRRGAPAGRPRRAPPRQPPGRRQRAGRGAPVPARRPVAPHQLAGVVADRRAARDVDVVRPRHPRAAPARHRGRHRAQRGRRRPRQQPRHRRPRRRRDRRALPARRRPGRPDRPRPPRAQRARRQRAAAPASAARRAGRGRGRPPTTGAEPVQLRPTEAGALVVVLSPLVGQAGQTQIAHLAQHGHTVVVVDTLPAASGDPPTNPWNALASRVRAMERGGRDRPPRRARRARRPVARPRHARPGPPRRQSPGDGSPAPAVSAVDR